MINFTDIELREMTKNPDVLRALANWHDCEATGADAIEKGLGAGNDRRSAELLQEADRIEAEY